MIELHTNTVAEPTLQLLQKLQSFPLFNQLRLVGGTALALQIGHRNSVDLDLFGAMKISAIAGRGTKKDFIDLFFLLQHFDLTQLIEFYQQKFDVDDIFHVVCSLTYFDDAEEDPQPKMYVDFNWKTAKKHIKETVLKA